MKNTFLGRIMRKRTWNQETPFFFYPNLGWLSWTYLQSVTGITYCQGGLTKITLKWCILVHSETWKCSLGPIWRMHWHQSALGANYWPQQGPTWPSLSIVTCYSVYFYLNKAVPQYSEKCLQISFPPWFWNVDCHLLDVSMCVQFHSYQDTGCQTRESENTTQFVTDRVVLNYSILLTLFGTS